MWFIIDLCGIICVILTYAIVLVVDATLVFVGVWTELKRGEWPAIVHVIIMQTISAMIFWAHAKCMT
jgi:hypothetical protein